jgi:hypothetical protein
MRASDQMHTPRAQRYPFQIPLHYRKFDFPDWHECRTVNISRTGILFETDQTLDPLTILEINVHFPSSVTLSRQGSVVRAADASCAIRIHHCHILPAA